MTCPHGMPKPTSCLDCMEDIGVGPPPAPEREIGPTILARVDGTCRGCSFPINVGDHITLVDGQWVHRRCVQ